MSVKQIIKGAFIITICGFFAKILGFLYRIFLSNIIGATGLGLVQMISPVLMMCIALSSGGIQLAVSRFVGENQHDKNKCSLIMFSGLLISGSLSIIIGIILFSFSPIISSLYLNNSQSVDLLRLLALTLPFTALHSCINGFFLGLGKPTIPAISQILEQLFKLLALYGIYFYFSYHNWGFSAKIAVLAILLSEIFESIYLIIVLYYKRKIIKLASPNLFKSLKYIKPLFAISSILTVNRIALTFLQGIEAYLLPSKLTEFGVSYETAIGTYGIVTGMVMPLIGFPATIIGSLSLVIMPYVAKYKTNGDLASVKQTSLLTVSLTSVGGILCSFIFFILNDFIGNVFFNQPLVGDYLRCISWICPFLYMSISLGSILHGLGKTKDAFIHNMISAVIRILFIIWFIPSMGISGFFWGMLISSIVTVILHFYVVNKTITEG